MTDAEERADLVASLQRSRFFLKHTLRDLDDEQVTRRTTVSELTLGGLVRHVGRAEQQWSNFIVEGPSAMAAFGDPAVVADWLAAFEMAAGETVRDVLSDYAAVASRTDELVMRLPDLDASQPLPSAPWFEPGATGTRDESSYTSSLRSPSTPDTPTSFARPSTGQSRWAERRIRTAVGRPGPARPARSARGRCSRRCSRWSPPAATRGARH